MAAVTDFAFLVTNKIKSHYSLRKRLLASASILLLCFLGGMGWALNRAFEQSVINNAEDALRNQVLLLMANVDVDQGRVVVPEVLSEARLTQAESTLFAQISTPQEGVVWRSPSLIDRQLPVFESVQGEFNFIPNMESSGIAPVYLLNFQLLWETEQGDVPFTLHVAEHKRQYLERLRKYREQVVTWLSILGVSLLSLLLGLLNWGLKPLVKVSKEVGDIERGERQLFDENYPDEVSRLTQNLNQLLNFEEQRIDRQKDVLGNLAHSLKTPLAVLHGLEYSTDNDVEVQQQLRHMQEIIDYQLQSAATVGRRRFSKPIDVEPLTEKVINSLKKIHQEKNIQVVVNIVEQGVFFGDQGDWLDLVGNLLDNAFKWAESTVQIEIINSPIKNTHRLSTILRVSDDGPGIDSEKQTSILKRGVRLDSQSPGHGLGLHIVKGLVDAYDGDLSVEECLPKGTQFEVILN